MKLKLRPRKGESYRIIVCDHSGRYIVRDFFYSNQACPIATSLVNDLLRGTKHIKKEVTQ